MAKGSCMLVVKQHSAEVTSAVWLPDGERIITGSHDKNMVQTFTSPCHHVQMPGILQSACVLMARRHRRVLACFSKLLHSMESSRVSGAHWLSNTANLCPLRSTCTA